MAAIKPKRVYLDGRPLDAVARTTLEAAEAAVSAGTLFNPANPIVRTQHVGEGPTAFYVTSTPGAWP